VIETTSFKKSSMFWCDCVFNNFIAKFVPSNNVPYKICRKNVIQLLKIWGKFHSIFFKMWIWKNINEIMNSTKARC
jgi:hypothetical protein